MKTDIRDKGGFSPPQCDSFGYTHIPNKADETHWVGNIAPRELSSIAIICDGILATINDVPDCPDEVKSAVVIRIGSILNLFSDTVEQVKKAQKKISTLKTELRKTTEQLSVLRQEHFGESSEKGLVDNDDNGHRYEFSLEDDEKAVGPKGRRKSVAGDNIKRVVVDHYPDDMDCVTCGKQLKSIKREKRVGTLRIIPEHVELIQNVYHTCACNGATCKENRPVLAKPIDFIMTRRGVETGFVVEAAAQKFFEHSTLFRMERRLANNNVNLSRQTIGANIAHLAGFLEPVQEAIRLHATSGHSANMDETPLRVLNPGKGKCDLGYIWVICRDERPWNPDAQPVAFYHYVQSRAGAVAKELLEDAALQYLQTDGYSGYNQAFKDNQVSGVRCNLHARRKFVEVLTASYSPFAAKVVMMFGQLYAVERAAAGLPPDERYRLRQTHSLPVMNALHAELLEHRDAAPDGLKKAINYTLKGFDGLKQFLYDGRLEMDNNSVERCIRGIALTKKNSLFAGSHAAAKVWATYYTLIESARLNGVNPRDYLNWVVGQIERTRGEVDPTLLMPWHCPTGSIIN